jgi:hypothetical protein
VSVAAVATVRPEARPHTRRLQVHRPSAPVLCFLLCLVPYLAVACYVGLAANTASLAGDGVARVAMANRILFSRDPHLAAIGFVWSPIPVLSLLPLVALKPIWPVLVTQALAGNLMSAVFMAGAVGVMHGLLSDLGLDRRLGWALTAGFALNPMIVLYAANSMSEAYFVFFLLLVVRHLHRWLRTRQTGPLVATGFYLGLAYLTRYEAGAAAIAVTGIVGLATFMRSTGGFRRRLRPAFLDSAIAAGPFLAAFVAWAVISWLITGIPFQQFSSVYGTEPQLQAHGMSTPDNVAQILTLAEQGMQWMIALDPVLPIVLVVCLVVIVRRRDWAALGAPAVLGSVLLFMLYVHMTLKVLPALRYYIAVIPLAVLLIGIVLSPLRARSREAAVHAARPESGLTAAGSTSVNGGAAGTPPPGSRRRWTVAVALVAVAVTIPASHHALVDPADDEGEAAAVQALVATGPLTRTQEAATLRFAVDRQVSRYMDTLDLGRGTVLIDDFLGFVVVMSSRDPDQYVITSDRDFQQVLADPAGSGIEYVLVPPDVGLGTLDAINRAYPGAYATGRGIGTLVRAWHDQSDNGNDWRLYRVSATG